MNEFSITFGKHEIANTDLVGVLLGKIECPYCHSKSHSIKVAETYKNVLVYLECANKNCLADSPKCWFSRNENCTKESVDNYIDALQIDKQYDELNESEKSGYEMLSQALVSAYRGSVEDLLDRHDSNDEEPND